MAGDDKFSLRFALKKAVKDRIYGPPPGPPPRPETPVATRADPSPPFAPPGEAPETAPAEAASIAARASAEPTSMLAPLRLLSVCEDAVHAARTLERVAAAAPAARFTARVPLSGVGRRYVFAEIPGGRGAREALAAAAEAARESGALALLGFADGYRAGDPGEASASAPGPLDDTIRMGDHAVEDAAAGAVVDVRGWPAQGVRELVGALPLLENHLPEPMSRAYVRVPAALLQGTVVRLSRARVHCRAASIQVDRFAEFAHLRDQVLVLVEDESGAPLPEHLLEAMSRLAGAAVYRPADSSGANRYLVERGYSLPLSGATLATLVAESEVHLFGGPGNGHLVLDEAPDFRPVPIPAAAVPTEGQVRAASGTAAGVTSVALRLVPRPPGPVQPDALLLTDQELGWLVRLLPFLPGRWLSRLHLLAGEGISLLLGEGPVPPAIPWGTPLRRRDPGTLFVEAHHDLDPDLDPEGLRVVAGLSDSVIEAWVPGRRLLFPRGAVRPLHEWMIPDESLVPEQVAPLDEGFGWKLEKATSASAEGRDEPAVETPGGISLDGRRALLGDASRLVAAGQFAEAAAIHERLGDHAKAARLYEKAAEDDEKRKARRRG